MAIIRQDFGSIGGGTELNPQVIVRTPIYGYNDSGYPYSKTYTIDLTKHYILDISALRSNAIHAYRTDYIDKGTINNIVGSSNYNLMQVSISGTTLSIVMKYSRDYYTLTLFQLD